MIFEDQILEDPAFYTSVLSFSPFNNTSHCLAIAGIVHEIGRSDRQLENVVRPG